MADLEELSRRSARVPRKQSAGPGCAEPPGSKPVTGAGVNRSCRTRRAQRFCEMMAERGWTAPTWPKEYGGGGPRRGRGARSSREEMARLRLPPPLIGFGLAMIGPLLLQYGTEEQKREHLPKIVRGEIRWCQGYSEPGAGSRPRRACRRAPCATATTSSSTARRSGRRYADKSDWMFMPRAHRPRRAEARRHHVPADRHGRARRVRCGRSS